MLLEPMRMELARFGWASGIWQGSCRTGGIGMESCGMLAMVRVLPLCLVRLRCLARYGFAPRHFKAHWWCRLSPGGPLCPCC